MENRETLHQDSLRFLSEKGSLKDKLVKAHQRIQQDLPFIARIAITLYDPKTRVLKTFLHSSGGDNPISNYQALLDNAPSLKEILKTGQPRVINDMRNLNTDPKEHNKKLSDQGYAASYTLPMYNQGEFQGFLFMNSYQADVFDSLSLEKVDLYAHLLAMMVVNHVSSVNTLTAAVKTTGNITHLRDPETGSHLDRMSRYSLLIARALASAHHLDDEYIQHIFMFAPLHDIGKIAIPDDILLKPAKLDEDEMKIMRTHTTRGQEIIDDLVTNFGLNQHGHVDILRNIALYHHEAVNGTGYPCGKSGDDIPFEARIVAVADIFDALTSERPYKKAWSNDEALEWLAKLAGQTLDNDCVQALISHRGEVEQIQQEFKSNPLE
ncbi:MAG: HD domain-containing protein [Gammaproteobacteria bacterium]|nr:HD domain-containing protein [Gammaproteobacteria bacterium]